MIILMGGQKGGSGKSTIAINIATLLANNKEDVVILDADVQATTARWVNDREDQENAELPTIHCLQKYGDIKNTLKDLNQRYTYVIVDVAGKDSKELRTGILIADILIVPFRASQMDLDTIIHLDEVIEAAKDFNPTIKVFSVLNSAPTNYNIKEIKESKEFLKDFPNFTTLNTIIYERKIYRDVIPEGKGVIETNHKKGNQEIKDLVKEILENGH